MSATCPYCGAKLNLGLKFCVVCGRHVTSESMGRVGGGLRGGFRPADITRRLDELITVARFRRSRKSHEIQRGARFMFINVIYLFTATGLFYAAIQFSLEMAFPGKFQEARIPFHQITKYVKEKTAQIKVPELKKLPNSDQVVIVGGSAPSFQPDDKSKSTASKSTAKKSKKSKKTRSKKRAKPASNKKAASK